MRDFYSCDTNHGALDPFPGAALMLELSWDLICTLPSNASWKIQSL